MMRLKNTLSVLLLFILSSAMCGCDFNPLKALQYLGDVDNSVVISDNVVTINVVGIQLPGTGGTNIAGGSNGGMPPVSIPASTFPGDLHFSGSNAQSFLSPVAPSAVGNPF